MKSSVYVANGFVCMELAYTPDGVGRRRFHTDPDVAEDLGNALLAAVAELRKRSGDTTEIR